jgi:hypothetical protein
MIHAPRSGLLDLSLRRYTFLGGKVDPLIFRVRQIHIFLCQNGTLLWKVDPSFRNSVTGSGNIASVQISYRIGSCIRSFSESK